MPWARLLASASLSCEIELRSSIQLQSEGEDFAVVSSTPTRWEGQILGRSGQFVGVVAGAIDKPTNNSVQVIFNIR